MTKQFGIYKCNKCGNIVKVLHPGGGVLVCCDEDMELLQAKTEDEGKEKHVPVIERTDKGIKVKLGSIPHPMEEKHYIEWIVVVHGNGMMSHFLKPGDASEAEFPIDDENVKALAYCNIHGLWTNK